MDAASAIPAPPGPLSPAEESLLEALAQPGADLASLAAARGLTLSALARWLGLPHVRKAFDALRELFDVQRRLWQEQHVRDAIEALNEVMKVSDSPVERRRAASAVLRAFTATLLPRRDPTNGARSANRARSASECHSPTSKLRSASECPPPPRPTRPIPLTYTPIDDSFPSRAPREGTEGRATTSTPSLAPSSQDSGLKTQTAHPDPTADLALSLLREAAPRDARSAVLALDPLLDEFAPRTPGEARAILEGLGDFISAIPGAAVSSEPATLLDPRRAVKRYTVTPSDRPPRRFAVTLTRAASGAWCFHAVTPLDTG